MISYKELKNGDNAEAMNILATLFREMYIEMYAIGLKTPLIEEGEKKWVESVTKLLGKVNHLILATNNDEVIGFAHGNIRFGPEYQGGFKSGFISHVYVRREYRNQKVASSMVDFLLKSLESSGVKKIDLDVLINNREAIFFGILKDSQKSYIVCLKLQMHHEYLFLF